MTKELLIDLAKEWSQPKLAYSSLNAQALARGFLNLVGENVSLLAAIESWKRDELLWVAQEKELKTEIERLRNKIEDYKEALLAGSSSTEITFARENAALRAEIANAPVVYTWVAEDIVIDLWTQSPSTDGDKPTHQARLVRIEKIPKEKP